MKPTGEKPITSVRPEGADRQANPFGVGTLLGFGFPQVEIRRLTDYSREALSEPRAKPLNRRPSADFRGPSLLFWWLKLEVSRLLSIAQDISYN